MQIIREVPEMQALAGAERSAGRRIALVPTMGARHAGKLIRLDFLVERATRISPWLERCLRPLLRLGNPRFYCNPMDELVAVASHR